MIGKYTYNMAPFQALRNHIIKCLYDMITTRKASAQKKINMSIIRADSDLIVSLRITYHVHVDANVFVEVLVQGKRCRCVLDEQRQHSNLDTLEAFLEVRHDLVGDEVAAFAAGAESKLFLPRHRWFQSDGGGCVGGSRTTTGMSPAVQEFEDAGDGKDPVEYG